RLAGIQSCVPQCLTLATGCLGRTLRIAATVGQNGVDELLGHMHGSAHAHPVIRGDLDRAAASEQVVPAATGRHLDAAFVDLGELASPNPSASRAAAGKPSDDGRKPSATGTGLSGSEFAEQLLHPIVSNPREDHLIDVVEHGLEGTLDRLGAGYHISDEATELGAHAVKESGILHFFLNDPIQFPDRVAVLGHRLSLHPAKLD